MNEIEKTIIARRKGLKRRNRSAMVQMIVSIVILLFLVLHVFAAGVIGAGPLDVLQVMFSTAVLMSMWFYKTTERESHENIARGLAGDLLIGMATRIAKTPIVEPTRQQSGMLDCGRYAHTIISVSTRQAGILEVANRIAEHRLSNRYGLSLKNGRLPRISSIVEEYSFTGEDLRAIMTSMAHDHEKIEIYKTILDLIQQSQICKIQKENGKNGKARILQSRADERQDA